MYQKAYGIIETLAPLHVGASSGEEAGNLNLIFRDQFTQTGIIPGSSIRGRFRADMRSIDRDFTNHCYGHEAIQNQPNSTTEALVKFEYASIVWLPVFCPGQPVVWVTCPRWLHRYQQVTKQPDLTMPQPYQVQLTPHRSTLFFNLGFLRNLRENRALEQWVPRQMLISAPINLVVVSDRDIGAIHDMALYRQSRVRLKHEDKIVDVDSGGFFNDEALPEGTILIFPTAIKPERDLDWKSALETSQWESIEHCLSKELYFGGLESIGFGRCQVNLSGEYFSGV